MSSKDSSYMPGVALRKALRARKSLDETVEYLAAQCLLGWLQDSEECINEIGAEAYLARAGRSEEFSQGAEVMAARKLDNPDALQVYATQLRVPLQRAGETTRLEVRYRGEDDVAIRHAAL